MRKFLVLLKKEIRELLTLQMLVPLVLVMVVFAFIGEIVGQETEEQQSDANVPILDLDQTVTSKSIPELLEGSGFTVTSHEGDVDQVLERVREQDHNFLLVIPEGFESMLENGDRIELEAYSVFTSFSIFANQSIENLAVSHQIINETFSNSIIAANIADLETSYVNNPIDLKNHVVVGDKQAQAAPGAVIGFITSQTTFIPIVLFLVITFASQLVAVAIATEKENKTLETLLSSPISRRTIVAAKLIAAGLVSLISATVYLIGMSSYMSGLTGAGFDQVATDGVEEAIANLDLVFGFGDYLILGMALFAGILTALSIAFILGSFAKDVKSAQMVIAPIMVCLLVPYFLTMFLDISSLSPVLRTIVYAIPFTHTFVAAPNILLNQYQPVFLGNLYLFAFFLVSVVLASKLFSSEKIVTFTFKNPLKNMFLRKR